MGLTFAFRYERAHAAIRHRFPLTFCPSDPSMAIVALRRSAGKKRVMGFSLRAFEISEQFPFQFSR